MEKISTNKFNTLEFEILISKDLNTYYKVYLTNQDLTKKYIASIIIDNINKEKSNFKLECKGILIHPKNLLAINNFINDKQWK